MKFKFKLHTNKNICTEQCTCKMKIIYVYKKLKIFHFLKKFMTWSYASTATEYEISITILNTVDRSNKIYILRENNY